MSKARQLNDVERLARIFSRVTIKGDCWLWQGHVHPNGYGTTAHKGRGWRVHRLVYTLVKGPVPPDHDVCHSCDVRTCINPAHLWIGTRKQNMEDCLAKKRHDSMKRTHCPMGHEYTPENTYWKKGCKERPNPARMCRTCQRIRQRVMAGWPEELALTMSAVPKGFRPVGGKFKRASFREDARHE